MNLVDEVKGWQEDLSALEAEKAKAEGKLEQAIEALNREGFATVEEAEAEYARLLEQKEKAEKQAEELLTFLKEKYKEFIERG